MGLDNTVFRRHFRRVENDDVIFIPNALERVEEAYNLLPARYVLVSGSSGSGKTSFIDYSFVLTPFMHLKVNEIDDIHWEILYFSLERKTMFKEYKWISWLLYANEGIIMSADYMMGNLKQKPTPEELKKILFYYENDLQDLMDYITIFDGKTKANTVKEIVADKAIQLGTFYSSDKEGIYLNHSMVPSFYFDEKNTRPTRKKGPEIFIELEYKGEKFTLTQNSHRYFPHNPKTLLFIVIDGINLLGKKEVLDEVSEYLATARDLYDFSPVVVTQNNRAQGDVTRLKIHGSDMSPQLEDIFKSSQMAFDADLVLGLFDAFKYKAYDTKGRVGGYQIVSSGTMSPQGISRFRSLTIMKNSFGYDSKKYGLKFLGEVGDFTTLPLPDKNFIDLEKVYAEIAEGK